LSGNTILPIVFIANDLVRTGDFGKGIISLPLFSGGTFFFAPFISPRGCFDTESLSLLRLLLLYLCF
jgi:hypothetical protein